jgi:hypothetical protein
MNFYKINLTKSKKLSQTMHRNDLNIKNKVYINKKSHINNWNKLALYFRISRYINSYKCLRLKIAKKFYNLLCETIFQAFLHVFFIFLPSSLLANSHILRSVRWPPTFTVTHRNTHSDPRPRSLMNFRLR